MIKRCSGCGAILQSDDPKALGYVPDLDKKICLRCFKMQNYGEVKVIELNSDNATIIKKINGQKKLVFFLIDFLNITNEVINTYRKINSPKVLVVNKIDMLPKSFKFLKIRSYLENYYGVKERIIFISGKMKESTKKILKIMEEEGVNESLLGGYTNSGKSTLINSLTNKNLTTSYLPNTTLDFLPISVLGKYTLYDTPGLIPEKSLYEKDDYKFLKEILGGKKLKEVTYQTKEDMIINILDKISIKSAIKNSITIYLSDKIAVERVFKDKNNLPKKVFKVEDNSDIIIRGICLINVKKTTNLEIGIKDHNLMEIRPSIFS